VRHRQGVPAVPIALMVQNLWPIALSWIAAIVASDHLAAAETCNLAEPPVPGEQGVDPRTRDGIGSICGAVRIDVSLDARNPSIVAILHSESDRVLWFDGAQERLTARAGPNTQARAPPQSS
jgi:hypothetical protein